MKSCPGAGLPSGGSLKVSPNPVPQIVMNCPGEALLEVELTETLPSAATLKMAPGPHPLAPELHVGAEDVAGGVEQLDALLVGEHGEHRRVDRDGSQLLRERAQAFRQRGIVGGRVVVGHWSQG